MASDPVIGGGRPSQDELAGGTTVIDFPPDVIPYLGFSLPFIDKPWNRSRKQEAGVQGRGELGFGVHIKKNFAVGVLASGFGLATGPGPLDYDRSESLEPSHHQVVGDAPQVGRAAGRWGGSHPGIIQVATNMVNMSQP
jgi:hypothetical protein